MLYILRSVFLFRVKEEVHEVFEGMRFIIN
jgi:hypothetical protein